MTTPYKYLPVLSPVYRSLRRVFRRFKYAGEKVTCPLCENNFNSWVSDPEIGSCPACDSESRHRLLWLFLQERSEIFHRTYKLLHFAPEDCLIAKFKNLSNVEYTTADISAPKVDVHTDIVNLIFEDNSFDGIICSHVLEHIPYDTVAMKELFRVLVPDGIAYIQVPYRRFQKTDENIDITDPIERKKRFGQFDHVRVYGTDLKQRLESVGFEVSEEYFTPSFTAQEQKKYGLWDDVIFCCKKPNLRVNNRLKGDSSFVSRENMVY
ncbi:MAG: class I SAM-dependent methyltransferase [Cyanobacteria bacterium P01_A01_bin.45]